MIYRALRFLACAIPLLGSACTLDEPSAPPLTGPSTFATSVSVSANPEVVSLGQSSTAPGQQSQIIVSVFDANGQPKANQMVALDALVNGAPSGCGHLSARTLTTGSDGRAVAVFTAPGFPPNCPSFNADGTVTIQATPFGSQASASAATGVNILMLLPASASSGGAFTASIAISPIAGFRNFLFDGSSSISPGHAIVSYRWTFSDGHAEIGPIIDHDFPVAGTYFVTLEVTDDIGQTAFRTALVTVS